MQDITPQIEDGKKVIEKYGNGGFTITNERFEGGVMLTPDDVHQLEINHLSDIKDSHVKMLQDRASDIEILLVGAGVTSDFFDSEIEKSLKKNNISVEYMNTGAACRTYNILLTEGRKVAALLLAV